MSSRYAGLGIGLAMARGMPELHVAHVLRKLDQHAWGGTETHVAAVSRHLADEGIASEVYAPGRVSEIASSRMSVPVRRFKAFNPFLGSAERRAALWANAGNIASVELPWRLWRNRRWSLAHVHTQGRIGGGVRTAMRLSDRPYVVSVHGPKLAEPDILGDDMAQRLAGTIDLGKPIGALLGSRRVLTDAARVICFNRDEHRALSELIGDRAVRMDHGVDAKRFAAGEAEVAQRALPQLGEGRVITLVGRLSRQKNQALAIAAFARVAAKDVKLVLAGAATDPEVEQALRESARSLGVADRVCFLGNIVPELVPHLFARSKLVILPSTHEAFGLVVLEAWAAHRPVLFSDVAGLSDLKEAVGTPEAALAESTPEAWGNAMTHILAAPERAAAWADAGRDLVFRRFGWETAARRLAEIYREAVAH